MKLLSVCLTVTLLICSTNYTYSADKNGKFAVKGAGKRLCSNFVKTSAAKTNDYYLYGGWLEGYLSSFNRFQSDNYDITPWQTTEVMLILLERHCKSNPDMHFMSATNSLIKTLFPIRLKESSELVKINVQNSDSYYYVEILIRAKRRLAQLGFYKGSVDSSFDETDVVAFSNYQESIGISVTGVPDQSTLMALFLKPTKKP